MRRARRRNTQICRLVALALLLLVSTDALAQTPVITGRVLAAGTDVPLRRVRIELPVRPGSPSEPMLTDDQGRFAIEVRGAIGASVPLTVSKGGYVTTVVVVRRENLNTPLDLRLTRGAAISGIVLDPSGTPAQGYGVTVRRVDANPERDGAPAEYSGTADDRGEYRIWGLARGTYSVTAGSTTPVIQTIDGKVQIVREVRGGGVQIRVETGDEVGGVQLVTPVMTPAQEVAAAAAEARRKQGLPDPKDVVLPRGTAAIVRGRVLTATRTPVADATVRTSGPTASLIRTDQDGRFEARGLRAGQYTVEAVANDMVWRYGQERLGQSGRPIAVAADQTVDGIDIVLPALRAIHGVVADEHGEPTQGARIQAFRVEFVGDRLAATPIGPQRRTDDRGHYRLWGLYDGAYLVSASMDGIVSGLASRRSTYATIYYPGSPTVSGAQRIDLRRDTMANLGFFPVTLSEVSGVALDGEAPLVAGKVQLIEARQQGFVSSSRSGPIQQDGTFAIRHVPPGNYVIQVLGDGPGRTGLFAAQGVSVGETPVHVTMKASHGTAVEGRLILEGVAGDVRPSSPVLFSGPGVSIGSLGSTSFQVVPVALDDRARTESRMAVIGSSEFFITGLFGPTAFSLRRGFADDWYLKSFTINGVEISDTGFDFGARPETITDSQLVLSGNGASIFGRLRESTSGNYFVVAFPTSREQRFAFSRRVKFVRASADGSFRVQGLPPGDYFVAAVDNVEGTADGGEWQNPELLLRLESGAERITLLEGQSGNVTLRLNLR
jgi:hypothetical protein